MEEARSSRWNNAALAIAVGVFAMAAAAAMAQDDVESLYQPRDPCPQVERIVEKAVKEAHKKNNDITAGFLRVFFHDCISRGCDASILLQKEWEARFNNNSLQPQVRELVNDIRRKVNRECGDRAVSCADILALATRDSVVEAHGPKVGIVRGRFDSLKPNDTAMVPGPGETIDDLLNLFSRFGLNDTADLVALSGGHTVGKTKLCGAVPQNLQRTCTQNKGQVLDVRTPLVFDNQYFVALTTKEGIFETDRNLFENKKTKRFVEDYARDKEKFFKQWAISMKKLSDINWVTPSEGEIRRDCTVPNRRLSNIMDADEGFAATA